MGLFSKKKDKVESNQTQEIKQATLPESQEQTPQNPLQASEAPHQEQESINNPFAQTPTEMPPQGQAPPLDLNPTQDTSPLIPMEDQMPPSSDAPISTPSTGMDEDRIQELIDETVEKVIEEKWEKVVDNVEKVLKWKDTMEQQVNLLKSDIVHFGEQFENFEKKILEKVSTYDSNLTEVNTEMKAFEKVFQKITPTLVNNVNELNKIADNLRGINKDEVLSSPKERKTL